MNDKLKQTGIEGSIFGDNAQVSMMLSNLSGAIIKLLQQTAHA